MAILGGKIGTDSNGVKVNLFHLLVVAPWLYYLSTGPINWQTYLQLTALSVGSYHLYRAYTKTYHVEQNLQKGDETILSMMF